MNLLVYLFAYTRIGPIYIDSFLALFAKNKQFLVYRVPLLHCYTAPKEWEVAQNFSEGGLIAEVECTPRWRKSLKKVHGDPPSRNSCAPGFIWSPWFI
jgi:hypothetical protein